MRKLAANIAVGDQVVRRYAYVKPTAKLYEVENVAVVRDTRGRERVQIKSGALTLQFRSDDLVEVVTD